MSGISRLSRTIPASAGLIILSLGIASSPATADEVQDRINELERRIETLADTVDNRPAANSRVSIGGYGELHYNNLDAEDPNNDVDQIDFHRFVLFFGYEFDDGIRFVSELELEHSLAGDGAPGEVELEQAYVEFDHGNDSTQAGLFLIPVGILNETHEPTTFYGVERNDVESIIIPSTWWEAGAQHIQRFGEGWQWNIAAHSGLAIPTADGDAFRIRSGRQKVAEAAANNLAVTTRLKYTGIEGLELAASVQVQGDPSQTGDDGLDDGTLTEFHVIYSIGPFSVRALHAEWEFAGNAVEAAANNADSQSGWYVEPSVKLSEQFGIYARASSVESVRVQDNFDQNEIGFNWWPHPQVVVKVDYRDREHTLASAATRDFDGFDVGLGYRF